MKGALSEALAKSSKTRQHVPIDSDHALHLTGTSLAEAMMVVLEDLVRGSSNMF